MTLYRARWLVLVVALSITACGGDSMSGDTEHGAGTEAGAAPEDASGGAAATDVPEACAFLTRDEIAEIIDKDVGEGEPEQQPGGAFGCRYRTPTSNVMVSTHRSDPAEFDEFRNMIGQEAEVVDGIGDSAYFWGPNLMYVRVGNLGFSLRINEELGDRLRPAMLALAEQGAAKLE
jgi:hypothetical protein